MEGNIPVAKKVLHTHILLDTYLNDISYCFSAGTMTDTDIGQEKILKDDDHKLPKFGEKTLSDRSKTLNKPQVG